MFDLSDGELIRNSEMKLFVLFLKLVREVSYGDLLLSYLRNRNWQHVEGVKRNRDLIADSALHSWLELSIE